MQTHASPIHILFLVAFALTGAAVVHAQSMPWERRVEGIPRVLDSLAALSVGPYVHFEVYGCPGRRCETRVSIWRADPADPYRYRGYGWVGVPAKPQFRGFTAELPPEDAGTLLARLGFAGITTLVMDSSRVDRWTPRFWMRARIGRTVVSIDGASLAANVYRDSSAAGLSGVYREVFEALVEPLHARHER